MTAAQRLAELIRMPTVSAYSSVDENNEVFAGFPDRLAELYPEAHKTMSRELIGERAILYKWEGSNPELEPVLGMAHYDVVPPGDESAWEFPPFSGTLSGGRIHGRGSLDDKGMLAAWMEAADRLASAGFTPERTLYLAFGGDEETTGKRGAGRMAEVFAERGLRFAFILDEGGAVAVDQLSSFTDRPVALVGIAEKGYLTLCITAEGMSGHASAPPKNSAIGRLSRALTALESTPSSPRLTEAPSGMLKALGEVARGPRGLLLKYHRLFAPLVIRGLSGSSATAPLVRTTLAPTVIRGGERDNVLPDSVEALVNLRLLPGDSVASAVERTKKIIARAVDGGVTAEPVDGSVSEPVPASGGKGPWWDLIGEMATCHFPGTVVAPYLMTGTTDSRWYRHLSDAIYRFIPMEVNGDEMSRVHSENESVSEENWLKSVGFLENLCSDALGTGYAGIEK